MSPALRAQEAYVVRPVASPCVNDRPSTQTGPEPLAWTPIGTQVTRIGTTSYWRHIRLADNRTNWAAKKYLELAAAPPDVAISKVGDPNEREDARIEVLVARMHAGQWDWSRLSDGGIQGMQPATVEISPLMAGLPKPICSISFPLSSSASARRSHSRRAHSDVSADDVAPARRVSLSILWFLLALHLSEGAT